MAEATVCLEHIRDTQMSVEGVRTLLVLLISTIIRYFMPDGWRNNVLLPHDSST